MSKKVGSRSVAERFEEGSNEVKVTSKVKKSKRVSLVKGAEFELEHAAAEVTERKGYEGAKR